MTGERFVAIDFETATREKASACALGLAVIEHGRIAEEHSWLIQPPGNIFEPRNTWIHGIDEDLVAQEPEFDELWGEIESYLVGSILLAHNASFDMAVLRASLDRYGIERPSALAYICTVAMARRVWPELPNHKLDCVSDHCGIRLNHHDAASDARACASIAIRCRDEIGAESIEALTEQLGLRLSQL